MKNPNGYGSITKLSGNRRKPYCVRITTGWEHDDETARQVQTVLGCYATREEAMIALAEYHKDPYKIEDTVTFSELYKRWSLEKYEKIGRSAVTIYKAAYACCEPLYGYKFIDLKRSHLQGLIDTCGKNYPTLKNIKILFSQLYKYAMQNDLAEKDYAKYVDLTAHKPDEDAEIHKVFSSEEISYLWSRAGENPYRDIILMLIYGGMRIGELLDLKKSDVHLAERYIDIKKSKTKAGIRKVPIADKVRRFYEYWMLNGTSEYLITSEEGKHIAYLSYRKQYFDPFIELTEQLEEHLPHDTRHTCISLLVASEVNEVLIKRIVGHQGTGVTDTVYTHFNIAQLMEAINKI